MMSEQVLETKKKKVKDNSGKIGFVKFFSWTLRSVSTGTNLMVMGYLTLYCTNYLGLNAGIVSILLVASKIIDAFTDLFAGVIVDRTNTKLGKARPYELAILGLWGCTWLLFSTPAAFSSVVKYIWVLLMYVMVNAVFMTLLNANGTAYTVRAFPNHQQHIKLSTLGFIVPMVGIAAFNIALPQLLQNMVHTHGDWSRVVGMISILMIAIGILRFIFVPEVNKAVIDEEKKETEKVTLKDAFTLIKKDKYILFVLIPTLVVNFSSNLGAGAYYFTYIVGNLGLQSIIAAFQILSIPMAFLMPMLLKRSTCVKLIGAGAALSVIGHLIFAFAGSSVPMLMAAGFLTGIGSVPASMLIGLLLIDLADYHEYIGINRMEGVTSALNGFAGKLGSTLATGASGILLAMSGFISTTEGIVEQPASAIAMIRALYSYIPAALWALTGILILSFKLESRMPQIREELAERRAAAAKD